MVPIIVAVVSALELLKDIDDLEKLKAEGSELVLDLIERRVEIPSAIAELFFQKEQYVLTRTVCCQHVKLTRCI